MFQAHPICRKLRELPDWDEDRDITQEKLLKLGPIMAGCGRDFFDDLPSTVIDGALTAIKDIDFDDTEVQSHWLFMVISRRVSKAWEESPK